MAPARSWRGAWDSILALLMLDVLWKARWGSYYHLCWWMSGAFLIMNMKLRMLIQVLSCVSSCLNSNPANFYSCGVGPVPRYAFLIMLMRLVTCKNLQGYNQSSEYFASECWQDCLLQLLMLGFPGLTDAENYIDEQFPQFFLFPFLSHMQALFLYRQDWLRACYCMEDIPRRLSDPHYSFFCAPGAFQKCNFLKQNS